MRKCLKKIVAAVSPLLVWSIIFINIYLLKGKRNFLNSILANLCFNDSLVFLIKPEKLKYHVSDPNILPEHLFIWAGDWDKNLITVDEHEKIEMMRELFIENKNYPDTGFYKVAVDNMEKGCPIKRGAIILDSLDNIEKYFNKHVKLFKEIKDSGFDLQRSSKIGVVIGRDGKIIHFREGHHSLAIAKILGINEIKIRIRAIHVKWLTGKLMGSNLHILSSVKNGLKELFL